MPVAAQLDRLLELGVADAVGLSGRELADLVSDLPDLPDTVLALHHRLVPARSLVGLLQRQDRPGFVVEDLTDLEDFTAIGEVTVPDRPVYLVHAPDRGDELRNASPDEALPVILGRGRTPLTVHEGLSWLLQEPDRLAPNHCFMTIASRKTVGTRRDPRTPALWISGGTGRDGRDRRGAVKLGWCWAGNRHTWLGFASARERSS